jgi:hypothetical protein
MSGCKATPAQVEQDLVTFVALPPQRPQRNNGSTVQKMQKLEMNLTVSTTHALTLTASCQSRQAGFLCVRSIVATVWVHKELRPKPSCKLLWRDDSGMNLTPPLLAQSVRGWSACK